MEITSSFGYTSINYISSILFLSFRTSYLEFTFLPDPFGLKTQFVGLDNFKFLLTDPYYLGSFKTTITFSILVTVSSMLIGLYLAALADRLIKGSGVYQTLFNLAICNCTSYCWGTLAFSL